jgi:hypothetical protein
MQAEVLALKLKIGFGVLKWEGYGSELGGGRNAVVSERKLTFGDT